MAAGIVITSFGSFGDVYPYVGLALGLRARGHRPVLAMPPYYRAVVEREGLPFHPVRPDVDPADRRRIARIMAPGSGTPFLIRAIVGSVRQSYADLEPALNNVDLLVTHPVTFAAPILAERLRLPWVSTVLAPASFFSVHDPPVFPPLPWLKRLDAVPGAARSLVRLARVAMRSWTRPVRELRRELGLPAGRDPLHEGQHSPRGVLALFSRALAEPQPDWPRGVHVTGAIAYNGPRAADPLAPDLERFLGAGPPPVVFTLGSAAVGAAGRFYHESAEAARRLGVRAVLLVGDHDENVPDRLPHDTLVARHAPHAALFPRSAAIVHQGGAGTLHQGLRAGRPTLVVPFAHDQPDNAFRVERLDVSRTLRAQRYSARRAARELEIVLGYEPYRERAATVGARVRAEDGVGAACDVIEDVLDWS